MRNLRRKEKDFDRARSLEAEAGSWLTTRKVILLALLTMVIFGAGGWRAWCSYRDMATTEYQYHRAIELNGIIMHFDEVLTMSAKMAAATGNLQWESRYREYEPKLDAAIKEAASLAPEAFINKAALQTDNANIKLVAIENKAFDLVRRDNRQAAVELLNSDEYEEQKRLYSTGMKQYTALLQKHVQKEYAQARITTFGTLTAAVFVGLLILSSWFVVLQLRKRLAERRQAEEKFAKVHRELLDTAREVGKGEVATSVLHNVGNVVNSVNITAGTIRERLRESKIADIVMVAELLKEHEGDLGDFLTNDERGQKIPFYLESLSEHLTDEQQDLIEMIDSLTGHVQHITEIVRIQQSSHKNSGLTEPTSVDELVEDAIAINMAGLNRYDISLRRRYQSLPTVVLDRHKLLQIIVNLISNAKNAVLVTNQEQRLITIRTSKLENKQFQIEVRDNGTGIAAENITNVFASGFTTRPDGHGYGLHGSALAAKEMGGSLNVSSEGPGKGATFTLQLPLKPAKVANKRD